MIVNFDSASTRRAFTVAVHAGIFSLSYIAAYALRFDLNIPRDQLDRFWLTLPILVAIRLVIFFVSRAFGGIWRYVGMRDLKTLIKAVSASSLVFVAVTYLFLGTAGSRAVILLDWMITIMLCAGLRLSARMFHETGSASRADLRAVIVGAGDTAEMLIREISRNAGLAYRVVGMVDDDPRKLHVRIHGVAVMGTVLDLPGVCRRTDAQEILIAVPSASPEERQSIVAVCNRVGLPAKTLPVLPDLLSGRARITQLHDVGPADLLPREAVHIDIERLRAELVGKRILVTGAGGSIGSELCRQVGQFHPESIVLYERAESALYFMTRELRQRHPEMKIVPVIGDILDEAKLAETMTTWLPDIVYHAAAYKHVPLMEEHPLEAVRNNIFGTHAVAQAAARAGVRRFVLISTDKAVRPVGVMGRTKRMAECVMQSMQGGGTIFAAVRFGNVLGSDGSVLPLFARQIATGGPVTLTHPDAMRYMMLISEAAQLVIQAGMIAEGGEVFFLEMGEPVRIIDLAHNLIRLSGFEPGLDMQIEVTGLRPGERLTEELVMDRETLAPSGHEGILMLRDDHFDAAAFDVDLARLKALLGDRDQPGVLRLLEDGATRH